MDKKNKKIPNISKLKIKYPGRCLLEIAKAGEGNKINYLIVRNQEYEQMLWDRDNQINNENTFYIGSSALTFL